MPNGFNGFDNYDREGNRIGVSDPTFTNGYRHSDDTSGCYVATCIYGSYDCPEVWTLRRFRDDFLAKSLPGRAFIRTYYAISPTIVRLFGKFKAFRSFWKKPLDKIVQKLRDKGVEDTPYQDKKW